jgi:hypothetical protein
MVIERLLNERVRLYPPVDLSLDDRQNGKQALGGI